MSEEQLNTDGAEDAQIGVEDTVEANRGGLIRGFLRWLRETMFIIVLALVLSVALRTFVFQAFYVPSGSMENTLLLNDRIIASKITTHFSDLHRGDVIVFHDPSNWLTNWDIPEKGWKAKLDTFMTWVGLMPSNSGDDLVKRLIGLPGDHIVCCDAKGGIVVNGYSLDESAYVQGQSNFKTFDIVVPAGRVFVMGDNREHSADSRYHLEDHHGTVPLDDIVGQVTVLIWPFDRFGTLSNPLDGQPIPNPSSAS